MFYVMAGAVNIQAGQNRYDTRCKYSFLGNQCISVAEMRTSHYCSYELAVTVKVTPKKCTWMSVVAVTSQQASKSLAEQSRTRHLSVHDMTHNRR